MTKHLKYLLSGILILTVATIHAQSGSNGSTDTTMHHRNPGMHRWGNRNGGPGGDSLAKRDGLRHNRPGSFDGQRDGYARRGNWGRGEGHGRNWGHGRGGFGHGGFGGEHIRYTPEQRKQVMAINKDYHQKSGDLYKQDNLTLKQYKAGLVALQKEKKDKLAALLTPQQKTEIAARRKEMDENRQVREVARLEKLKLHLNLSDDQVAKIKAGQENLHSQIKAIHENDNLLPQQKMEQMKTLMAKRNDTYKSVLTPDQYTQFEKMSHRRAGKRGFLPEAPGSRAI